MSTDSATAALYAQALQSTAADPSQCTVPTKHEYQVVARCTDPSHPGATTLIYTTHAASIQEATAKVQKLRIDTMTPGLYRITQVTEREPECTCANPGFGGKCAGEPWCAKVEVAAAAQPVPE